MIRVLVADDDPGVLAALSDLIAGEPGMKLVAAVEDAEQAVAESARLEPDVAVIDVRMPGGGAFAVREIARSSPQTKVLALSGERDRKTVLEMLEAGSVGYLTKGCAVETIVESIVRAASGEASLSAEVAGDVISEAVDRRDATRQERTRRERKVARIRHVLGEGGFRLAFQPIVDLASGETIGVEALSRFPRRPPDRWFAEATEVGLGTELELAAAAKAVAALESIPPQRFLSLNISPGVVTTRKFRDLIGRAQLNRVVVEITEHAAVADYDNLEAALETSRKRGLRLAVDDAGAGFASLRHILRLAPDFIKLDRTLIGGIDRDRSQQALAGGLTTFAQGIDAMIVAEGVERAEEIAVLTRLGVPYAQGFFLGRPALAG